MSNGKQSKYKKASEKDQRKKNKEKASPKQIYSRTHSAMQCIYLAGALCEEQSKNHHVGKRQEEVYAGEVFVFFHEEIRSEKEQNCFVNQKNQKIKNLHEHQYHCWQSAHVHTLQTALPF